MGDERPNPARDKRRHNEWLNIVSDIEEENAQLPPVACICGRGNVTSIVGCDYCWEEHCAEYLDWLENLSIKDLLRR